MLAKSSTKPSSPIPLIANADKTSPNSSPISPHVLIFFKPSMPLKTQIWMLLFDQEKHGIGPKPVQTVVRSDESYRPFLASFAKALYPGDTSTGISKISFPAQQAQKVSDVDGVFQKVGDASKEPLPFDIHTVMPAAVVSNNRLRLVGEDKPPDPTHNGAPLNPNCEDGVIHVENIFGDSESGRVYASPIFGIRQAFWEDLAAYRRSCQEPWLLIGDFNDILHFSEQRGGTPLNSRKVSFACNMESCELMDLGYFGAKHTWRKACQGGRIISRRLDRGVCSDNWHLFFSEATVEHLMRRHSDHCSLLLRCRHTPGNKNQRPFRFQAALCTHPGYANVVSQAWEAGTFFKKLFCCKEVIGTFPVSPHQAMLPDDGVATLFAPITKEEVSLLKSQYEGSGYRGSHVWTSIQKAWGSLEDDFAFKLGNGDSSFWYKLWLSNMRVCDQVLAVDIHDITLKDTMVWKNSLSGTYTENSGYKWLLDSARELNTEPSWRWVWKSPLPASLQFFIWLIRWNALPTNSTLHARGGFIPAVCPLCHAEEESLPHCLLYCHLARGVWESFHLYSEVQPVPGVSWLMWVKDNYSKHDNVFLVALWKIWCARNKYIFEAESATVQQVVSQTLVYSFYISKAFDCQGVSAIKEARWISWQHPQLGYIELNVDGSVQLGKASYGELLRDDKGSWITDFWDNLGQSEILHAELQAIYYGLNMCWEKGYMFINCYSDFLLAVNLIKETPGIHRRHATLLAAIQGLMKRAWFVSNSHLLREGNTCADYLAK
ncbi:Ribonuclease H domain [Sesbania bispinosa]|nr:Ribonuclease H domain [Sesbania bispinosa]